MVDESGEAGGTERDDEFARPPRGVIVALVLAFLGGLVVVGVASAMETGDDCTTYGYGGYNCVNYEDARLEVDPDTDLVDRDQVFVSGFDFDPRGGFFTASQCLAEDLDVNGQDNCDPDTTVFLTVNSQGNVFFFLRVKRILETNGVGDVDCAVQTCVIGGATVDGTPESFVVIEGTSAPLHFDASVPPPNYTDAELFVDPSTDLVDRQTVTVTGSKLDPRFSSFGTAQCDAALVQASQIDACDLSTSRISTVDGDGNAEVDLVVRRIITTPLGGEIDCAVPGACVIGAGTFEGFATAIEGATHPISFDPAVPPVPPLELELEVDEVTADAVSGTVSCNREASFYFDAYLSQMRAGQWAEAYAYLSDDLACGTDPVEFTVAMMPFGRRLVGGPAEFVAYGSAYDGFESADAELARDVVLQGAAGHSFPATTTDGMDTTVRVIGTAGSGDDLAIRVEVFCGRAVQYAFVDVVLRQWAGRDLVEAYGFERIDGCDGVHYVNVPVMPSWGVLVGGPAQVGVNVWAEDYNPPEFYFDRASATDEVRLTGQIGGGEPFEPVPNPGSRITIERVTRTSIEGTVECEEPVMVDISGYGVQQRGRTFDAASGYGFFDCDGTVPFSLDLAMYDDGLHGGQAAVSVSAYGFRIIDMNGYPYYEFVWSDWQEASVRVRGSG